MTGAPLWDGSFQEYVYLQIVVCFFCCLVAVSDTPHDGDSNRSYETPAPASTAADLSSVCDTLHPSSTPYEKAPRVRAVRKRFVITVLAAWLLFLSISPPLQPDLGHAGED